MLKRFGRRFYSAKYVYSVHLHRVSPWFIHDKPAKVIWRRGTKKHKKGDTAVKTPTRVPGSHINSATLDIEEGFEVGVTLYAASNKTKKTGPYGAKELRMVIMEIDNDGSVYSILGAVTINLSDYVGLVDHKLKIPIECDNEIVEAVGQPQLEMTIRSWYKQGHGGLTASSGISSTGWEGHEGFGSDDDEEGQVVVTPVGDASLDPVKPLDAMDPLTSPTGGYMDAVPENIEANGTTGQGQGNVTMVNTQGRDERMMKAVGVEEVSRQSAQHPVPTSEAIASLAAFEAERNNVHEESGKQAAVEKPSALLVAEEITGQAVPVGGGFLSAGHRYKRLSTINSETGDEVVNLLETDDDALNKFIEEEAKDDEFGLPSVAATAAAAPAATTTVQSAVAVEQPPMQEQESKEATTPTPGWAEVRSEPSVVVSEEVARLNSDEPEEKTDVTAVDSNQPPSKTEATMVESNQPQPKTEVTELASDQPPPKTEDTAGKSDQPQPKTEATEVPSHRPVTYTPSARRAADVRHYHPKLPPTRRGFWSCFPGSGLICCQPILPREP